MPTAEGRAEMSSTNISSNTSSEHGPVLGEYDGAALTGGLGSAVPNRSEGVAVPGGIRSPGGLGSGRGQGPAGPAQRSAVASSAAGPWPTWALPQLRSALELAQQLTSDGAGSALARGLYRGWYAAQSEHAEIPLRPLAGLYRAANVGRSRDLAGLLVLDRLDHVGPDGWWRTWNAAWAQARRGPLTRVLLSPRPDRLAQFVAQLTGALQRWSQPWLLACPTTPARLARAGSTVLFLPGAAPMPAAALNSIGATLRVGSPPLCRPLAPGVAVAQDPDTGMSFGEHRCHLVALAVRCSSTDMPPLQALAQVFIAHGVDPSTPHLSGRR
jgi:hypothetical protein